ncbi:MAG TPA: hypothetical protein VFO10_17920 [Oligoflexus sp.]|uniref:hypothetical protein n=1 Tax=Oligoflexus sp. TaxID=1971216 RepID=UPI002D7EFA5D|nr:hypothetical protein [Oligoflexus sp.]HET9239142.1 hypothetical protein [Oligoflexus sp.]
MKLHSCAAFIFAALIALGCDSKKDESSKHDDHADAAVQADDPTCAATHEHMGLHGDLSGFTASAAGAFHVKIEWNAPLKASSLENKATVTFVDEHAEALPLKLTGFKLFMPSMGHGSSKADQMVLTQDKDNANVWSVAGIYFSMGGAAGDWVVDVEAGGCGSSDKARVSIPVEVQ